MSVCFIDTETLGLDPDHNPVWEVGLILPDGTEREWQIEVTPREIALAHPKALEISRFHERHGVTRSLDSAENVAKDLNDCIQPGTHLAGAVVSFDEERLRRLMWKHGYSPRWHYHIIDVEGLAAGYLAGCRRAIGEVSNSTGEALWAGSKAWKAVEGPDHDPPWDSEELSRAVGVQPDRFDRHTALGDARWAKAVYEAVMGNAR